MYDFLIAGLGNPGAKYEKTRHNTGWMVIFELCKRFNLRPKQTSSIYYTCSLSLYGKEALLCLPTTYMNDSGEAIKKLKDKYKLDNNQIIVIVDEYNFPISKVHLKSGGSDGGHNGVGSIISELNALNFYRLRCGIDKKFEYGGLVDYVLSNFSSDEVEARDLMISKAADAVELLLKIGPEKAMSDINSGRLWLPEQRKEPLEVAKKTL